jgi:hypothetical protein
MYALAFVAFAMGIFSVTPLSCVLQIIPMMQSSGEVVKPTATVSNCL